MLTGQYVYSEGGHDTVVHEFGYGLGPPTGILVLRHNRGEAPIVFPESRDDYRHQVVWSPDGVLAVRRGATIAHIGPSRGFWVRRATTVEIVAVEPCTVYMLCLRQVAADLGSVAAGVVSISEPVRDAILTLCRPGTTEDEGLSMRDRLVVGLGTPALLETSGSGNGLARQVAVTVLADPADPTELNEWADRLYTCVKTLQRDFVREFGMPWRVWRTRVRLQASTAFLERLPVGEVAHRVGYASASAYVQAFKREYGATPGVWLRTR